MDRAEHREGSLSYEEWNQLLCRHFFRPENADQLIWFCPDDEVLGELSNRHPEAAIRSLESVVRRRLDLGHYNSMFIRFERESVEWKRKGGADCPPFLGLLAIVVLAAVHMARENRISSTNYYTRLRELLGLEGRGQPRGYGGTIPKFWAHLAWWMDEKNGGSLGKCTVVKDERQRNKNIGFALSQTLIRRADRQRLTHFFQWMDLEPGEDISSEEFLARFRVWASGRAGLSPGIHVMLADDHFAPRLGEALTDEAARWDGLLRDDKGRKVGRIYLTLELAPAVSVGLAAERPEGFPEAARFLATGHHEVDISSPVEGWYSNLPSDLLDAALGNGLRMLSGEYALEFAPDFVIPLRQNADLGLWASVRDVTPGEPHCLLVQESRRPEVLSFLKEFAVEQWSTIGGPSVPKGWFALRGVVIGPVPAYDGPLRRLVPSVKNRLTLQGGLPLREHRLFLSEGEPDVWIPTASDNKELDFIVDGMGRKVSPGSMVPTFPAGVEAGYHRIKVGNDELFFRTVKTLGRVLPDVDRPLKYLFLQKSGSLVPESLHPSTGSMSEAAISICGASIAGDVHEGDGGDDLRPVILRVGARERVLLGAIPGQVSVVDPVPVPNWMHRAKLVSDHFETYPVFPVVWILQRWAATGWTIRLRANIPPSSLAQDKKRTDLTGWVRFLTLGITPQDAAAAALWRRYEDTAKHLL